MISETRDPAEPQQQHPPEAELPDQPGERVGIHDRLGLAGEGDVGFAAVRPVPDEHLQPAFGELFGQLANARRILGETAAGCDRDGLVAVADDVIGDADAVDVDLGHGRFLSRVSIES